MDGLSIYFHELYPCSLAEFAQYHRSARLSLGVKSCLSLVLWINRSHKNNGIVGVFNSFPPGRQRFDPIWLAGM